MEEKAKAKKASSGRFLGWQKTPIHQAMFGQTTRGGVQNTKFAVKNSTGSVQSVQGEWYVIDASAAPLGRIATTIATLLMGKHKAYFTPSADSGNGVIVINAEKTYLTSDKADKRMIYWHSGFMGGLKSETTTQALQRRPDEVVWMAVQGMLPKNKISRYQLARLKIYKGAEHPHVSQKPIVVNMKKPLKGIAAA